MKTKTIKQEKAAKKRAEKKRVQSVRPQVEARDGRCRVGRNTLRFGVCKGPGEWAHFGDKKRFKTMRKPPEERHTTEDSLMLCKFVHHAAYDENKLKLEPLDSKRRCNGRLRYAIDDCVFEEPTDPPLDVQVRDR